VAAGNDEMNSYQNIQVARILPATGGSMEMTNNQSDTDS